MLLLGRNVVPSENLWRITLSSEATREAPVRPEPHPTRSLYLRRGLAGDLADGTLDLHAYFSEALLELGMFGQIILNRL
jgi:hypothetical protein